MCNPLETTLAAASAAILPHPASDGKSFFDGARYAIDFEAKVLHVRESLVETPTERSFKQPKTISSRRAVDIGEIAIRALKNRFAFARLESNAAPSDLVFPQMDGTPLRRRVVRRIFERLKTQAGISSLLTCTSFAIRTYRI